MNKTQLSSRTVEIFHQFERDQSFVKNDCANQTKSVPFILEENDEGWMSLSQPQIQNITSFLEQTKTEIGSDLIGTQIKSLRSLLTKYEHVFGKKERKKERKKA